MPPVVSVEGREHYQWNPPICRPKIGSVAKNRFRLVPSGHYSLHCRQQACERISAGDSAEQAAPHCKDPTRLPDPSTLLRWAQRRLLSVWFWVRAGAQGEHFLRTPTILAWDLGALCRILPIEARSP